MATDQHARTTARFDSASRVMAVAGLIGLIVTASVSWTAWRIDRNNEHRLLQLQTRQAANVVTSAIVGIQDPLETALDIAVATAGDPAQFASFMSTYTATGGLFVSASLWRTSGPAPVAVASAGEASAMSPTSPAAQAFIQKAMQTSTFVVTSIAAPGLQRVGYALANPAKSTYAVYAERVIPANRQVPVESNSAFAELYYATYLGPTTSSAALETTDVAVDRLPLSGDTVRETIPFGDSSLTLVTAPIGHLGGAFGAQLPWILLTGGIVLTIAAAFVAGQLVRRRTAAESSAYTISDLYEKLDGLYGQQRTISETLQRAVLPQSNPVIPGLEIASCYVAGDVGVEIGGDWYSVIQVDDDHFAFVVGDISGHGVAAVAIMARIRFTLRAYLVEGHPPNIALALCSRQLDINVDGHMATVLVGIGELNTRRVTLANAGHPNPLVVSANQSNFVNTLVGPPLGVAEMSYESTTFVMERGSTLVAFTDGLVERRNEDIGVGLQRLATAATSADGPLDALLAGILAELTHEQSEDDTAILAFRWVR
jgi:serine phosphatase RsbU (regulator of sigma subunit)